MMVYRNSTRGWLLALVVSLALPLAGCEKTKKPTVDSGGDGPPDPQAYVDAAFKAMDEGSKLEAVHSTFQDGCDLHKSEEWPDIPIHVKACFNTGVTAAKMGDNKKAIDYYKTALKGDDASSPLSAVL